MNNNNNSQTKMNGLLLAAGVALGYVATLFFSSSEKQKQKDAIQQKANQIKDLLAEEDLAERIKDVFKENSGQARSTYSDIKDTIISNLSDLEISIKKVNKDKYVEIVKDVLDQAKKEGKISKDEVSKLRDYLENDYKKIKNSVTK